MNLNNEQIDNLINNEYFMEKLVNKLDEIMFERKQKAIKEILKNVESNQNNLKVIEDEIRQKYASNLYMDEKELYQRVTIEDFVSATFDDDKKKRLVDSYTQKELNDFGYGIIIDLDFSDKIPVKLDNDMFLEVEQNCILSIPSRNIQVRVNRIHCKTIENND